MEEVGENGGWISTGLEFERAGGLLLRDMHVAFSVNARRGRAPLGGMRFGLGYGILYHRWNG